MNQRIQILNSKLLIPSTSDIIKRERLYPLLAEIPKKRLTTVIAGAGYGKTTLIAQVSKYLGLDTVWYSLDKSDRDFIAFLSYLIAGIEKYFTDLGGETHQRIEEAQVLTREREAVLTVFLSEIEKFVKNDLIIVLDDYHLIQDSQEINESLKFLLEHLPLSVHLIIISRSDTGLPISRLRAQRQVLDIREENLVFSIPEIEELYLQLFNIFLPNESLITLQQKTDGWVSGLILFYHSLRWKSPDEVEELLLKLKGSHQMISDYLEENLFDLQHENIKDFLIKTSILSRIDAEFCNLLLGITGSRDILNGLSENHLFTFPIDEDRQWYYYHQLFHEFLLSKLHHELNREAILNLHREAAVLWEKHGEDEEALKHYILAEKLEDAGILLRKIGRRLLKEGRLQLINSYFKKIPESLLNNEPWIQYMQAQALQMSGKVRDAIRAYERAHETFCRHEYAEGIVLCLHRLSFNYFVDGDFPKAESTLKELLIHEKDNPFTYIDILGNLIFVASFLGKFDVADQCLNEAISLLKGADVSVINGKELLAWVYFNQGNRYINSGDFNKALELGEQTKEICKDQEFSPFPALGYNLISCAYYYLGHFSKGLENARKGLDLVREAGLPDISRVFLLIHSAANATELGKTTEAINHGKESLRIFQDQESRWCQAWAYHVLHFAYMKSGNMLAAEECLISGLELIQGLTVPLTEGLLKGSLAQFLLETGKCEQVQPLLEDAQKLLGNSKFNLSRVYLWYSRFYWEQNQREAALSKLMSALQLCETNQYDIWVISEKQWIVSLLVEIFARGKMQGYVQRIFKEIGPSAMEELTLLQKSKNRGIKRAARDILAEMQKVPPPGLRVYCLGKFRVYRGDEEIPAERWKSKKAMMLFKYLVCLRSRGYVSKEVLMEFLWPEEDPEKSAKRLHVALPSLRKTLEPEISRGTPSSYLLREGDSYKLNLGDQGWLDVDEFKEELKLAREEEDPEKAILHYLNAEAAYRGDFLEEDIYTEWCQDLREGLKQEYLDVLVKTMEYFERKGQYPRCIEYARKYLKMDIYAENIYRQLMKYYSLIGNKAMVAKTFERCKENIVHGLDSPLSNETEELYQKYIIWCKFS